MDSKLKRREFLKTCATAGMACCAMFMGGGLVAACGGEQNADAIDPKKLNYCGYTCPKDCKFLKGTLENNVELKKEAHKLWKLKERYNVDFDENIHFCYGCKTKDKPEGYVLTKCTVRACAQEKGHDSCIQCDELPTCDKDLWTRFPDFKKGVDEMQKKYKSAQFF